MDRAARNSDGHETVRGAERALARLGSRKEEKRAALHQGKRGALDSGKKQSLEPHKPLRRNREEVENSEVGRERGRRPALALTTTRRLARLERLLHKGIAATCLCPTHVARPRLEADCRALAQSVDTQLHPGALSFLLPRSAVCEGQ